MHPQLPAPKRNRLRRTLGVVVLAVAGAISLMSLKAGLVAEAEFSAILGVAGAAAIQVAPRDRDDPPPPGGGGGGRRLAPIPIRHSETYRGL